jgi:hypothetical protein
LLTINIRDDTIPHVSVKRGERAGYNLARLKF